MDINQTRRNMCHMNIYCISSLLFLVISLQCANAGPVIRSSRMVREIYPEVEQEIPDSSQTQVCIVGDVVYGSGENVPAEQPCLKCTCAPPEVRCETEICVQQPGCKTIHRQNKCCPDYQCECQHEGKTYANGERLPAAPGGECLVCYCRGGEVQCAEVGCYTRSDCDPRYVKGQCCPIYDHCPPREPLSDRVQYTTIPPPSSIEQDFTPSWISTGLPLNVTEYVTQETPDEGSGEYEPSVSSEDTLHSSPTTPNPILNDETTQRPSTPITFSIKEIELKTNNNQQEDERIKVVNKVDKSTQTDSNGRPQITIQEVIPSRTEYKITSPPQKEVPPRSVSASPLNVVTFKVRDQTLSTANPIKLLTDSSNDLSDVESYASEKTEVYDHPPPVLRIGDQLLFIKQGQLVPEKDASTPTPVITLIGAEGLQIGLGSGELLEHEMIPMNHDEPSVTSQTFISTNPTAKKLEEAEIPVDLSTKNTIQEFVSSEATETTTVHVIVEIEEISDDNLEKTNSSELLEPNDSSNEFITVSENIDDNSNTESVKNETKIVETEPEISSIAPIETSTQTMQENPTTSKLNDITSKPTKSLISKMPHTDNAEYIPEENPYYPPIPEDIMIFSQEESTTDRIAEIAPSSTTKKIEESTLSATESVEAVSSQSESVEIVTDNIFKQVETDNKPETLGEEPIKPRTLVANISSAELISVIPLKTIDESDKTESTQESETFSDNNSEKPEELATTLVVLGTDTPVSKSDDINIKKDSSISEGVTKDSGKESNKELASDVLGENKKEIIKGDSMGTEKEINMKILPEILDMRSNKTVPGNETSSQEWLKSETPTKITIPLAKDFNVYIPLINEKAALPDSLLKMPAPTDLYLDDQNSSTEIINHERIETTTDSMVTNLTNCTKMDVVESVEEIRNKNISFESTENISKNSLSQINNAKSDKLVAKEVHQKEEHDGKSTETMEVNEELFDSAESTTSPTKHSLLMSNEDASVEMIQNDSAPMDSSDLVETVPGFENISSTFIDVNKNEQDLREQPAGSPKLEVEMIEVNTQKEVTEDVSHVEIKDFHDEIQKRDVVKKVLTDTFENPKENIQTELTINDNKPQEISQTHFNEEQNIVRPTDNHDLSTRSLNSNSTISIKVNETTIQKDQEKSKSNKEEIEEKNGMKVIQKVNHDNAKVNIHDSTENLDTGALGALRDFFKSQFRRHDSRSVD
ncbi:uncharacterized protein CBL_20325 [Carabus blaptoides fortunei]